MRWRVLLALASLVLAPALLQAQSIRGVVLEEGTGRPIPLVQVDLTTGEAQRIGTAHTDSAGEFILIGVRPGDYRLHLTHLGFQPLDGVEITVGRGEVVQVEIRMGERAIPIEPLVVTARVDLRLAGFRERLRDSDRNFGRFVTREEIERRPGARASELLRQIPGVQLARDRTGGNYIGLRGARGACTPTLYVDGFLFRQIAPIDEVLSANMLEGVEIYNGLSSPAGLPALDTCGVVAFWTRGDEEVWRPLSSRRFLAAAGAFAVMLVTTLAVAR